MLSLEIINSSYFSSSSLKKNYAYVMSYVMCVAKWYRREDGDRKLVVQIRLPGINLAFCI